MLSSFFHSATGEMKRVIRVFAVVVCCAGGLPRQARSQVLVRSWLPWHTIETEHFVFHYPTDLEQWTQYLAARIEPIDSAVTSIVGYRLSKKTDIVVDDPYAVPNGSAWPFLKKPVINFWATPPDPREDIGDFRVWGEMLASHEFAHIVHLSRPSRNPFVRRLWNAMPVALGPIPLKAPRWVIEGYATYVEGRVTGSGRPHGAWRAAFLREWALEGQLPTYEQMSNWGAYAGGEFAYLAGSAYLEWLAARKGDSSLVHLWRRMSARQNRTFDDAFIGVYGEPPRTLYGRFAAELTGKALTAQKVLSAASLDTGAIVQRLAWSTGDPAIAADGSRVALLIRSPTRPARIVIWKTAPEPDTSRVKRDSVLLARDPDDVPAQPIYPPPKKVLATLRAVGGSAYQQPRFLHDGRVLVWRNTARGDGSLAPDLYLWNPQRHAVKRVTRGAYLRDADPSPDGHSAAAMQCRHGWCDLALVSLDNGDVRTLERGTPVETWFRPRWSPDGTSIVASLQTGGVWRIAVVDVGTGSYRFADPDDGANRYDAAFISRDTVVVVSDRSGVPNLERVALASGAIAQLTNVTGAAVAPEVNSADHSVWFLSLYSKGYDLRRIPSAYATTNVVASLDPQLAPAAPPTRVPPTAFSPSPIAAPQRYSLGDRLFRWLPTPEYGADGGSGVLALVSSDIVGKSELLVQGAAGDLGTWRGSSASLAWRGTRWPLHLSAFDATQIVSGNRAHLVVDPRLDQRLQGATLDIATVTTMETMRTALKLGGSTMRGSHLDENTGGRANRTVGFYDVSVTAQWRGDNWRLAIWAGDNLAAGHSAGHWLARDLMSGGISIGGPVLPPVTASLVSGSVRGSTPVFEYFSLGGLRSPLVDGDALTQRIAMPALPTGTATGTQMVSYRVAIPGALTPYLWAGGVSSSGTRRYVWHRVVGLDATTVVPNIALAGTPAARLQLGAGESIDPPLRHRVQGYVSVVFNP